VSGTSGGGAVEDPNAERIDIDLLNCPNWLKEGLKKLDFDGDGLEKEEIDDMLQWCAEEKKTNMNNDPEISYTHMPEQVQEVMKMWDQDLSGSSKAPFLKLRGIANEEIPAATHETLRALRTAPRCRSGTNCGMGLLLGQPGHCLPPGVRGRVHDGHAEETRAGRGGGGCGGGVLEGEGGE